MSLASQRLHSLPRPSNSTHIESTIYIQNMAGDVARHRRGEKQCGIDDFAHIPESAERNLFLEVLSHFAGHAFAHSNIDESRRNRIDGDVLTRKLARRNLR